MTHGKRHPIFSSDVSYLCAYVRSLGGYITIYEMVCKKPEGNSAKEYFMVHHNLYNTLRRSNNRLLKEEQTMSNGDYGYFGKGDTGYAQYMTAFNRNFGGSSGGGGGGNHNNNGGGGGGDGSGCGCLIAIAVVVVLILIVLGG